MKAKDISADSKKGTISIGEVEITPTDLGFIAIIIALLLSKPAQKELT
ncbi:hypothetical protein [uncultured Desulfovibrio sp.]|nr:hypothetical protein [uncultured Desulfovibrio sp.]